MFENIKSLRPYFFSLREIDSNVSLDLKLPLNWLYEKIVAPYSSVKIKVQDKNEKFTLLSFIANATQDGYDVAFACALEVITKNKEEEEKERLFKEKQRLLQEDYQKRIKELQELFKKESLEKLKDINLLSDYGQEFTSRDGMVEQGIGKGQKGDREAQAEDD